MDNDTLIAELCYSVSNLKRGWKVYKCDIQDFDYVTEEMIKRNMISEQKIAEIKKKIIF